MKKIREFFESWKAIIYAVAFYVAVEAADMISTSLDTAFVQGFVEEGNEFGRYPFSHKAWLLPLAATKAELVLIYVIPLAFVLYKAARTAFSKELASLISTVPIWLVAADTLKEAVFNNVSLLVFYRVFIVSYMKSLPGGQIIP